ncbi:hypothetical protein PHYSODRAFT_443504, partial [Phytophthora sojae]
MAQYQELVQGISLAQEKAGTSEFEPDSILAEAFKLRYQFEEIPDNQRKLSRDDDPLGAARPPTVEGLQHEDLDSPVTTPRMSPRIRCPSFHSYYATFDGLSGRVGDTVKAAPNDKQSDKVLTPRSISVGSLVETLASRFESDRIYTYVNHHTMIVMNPYRLLQTARFTSIYDEQVVLAYADTASAEASLAPHPFAMAKQSLTRNSGQSLFLCGESGSGKTELAKDLLKYLVLVAQPSLSRDSD